MNQRLVDLSKRGAMESDVVRWIVVLGVKEDEVLMRANMAAATRRTVRREEFIMVNMKKKKNSELFYEVLNKDLDLFS